MWGYRTYRLGLEELMSGEGLEDQETRGEGVQEARRRTVESGWGAHPPGAVSMFLIRRDEDIHRKQEDGDEDQNTRQRADEARRDARVRLVRKPLHVHCHDYYAYLVGGTLRSGEDSKRKGLFRQKS